MEVGIGLPTAIPDVEGATIPEWATKADEAGFSALGSIDRLVYPGYDVLTALAAASAVTQRIRLMTSILIAPVHTNAALLAKQTASLDRISGGRLTLGMGLGARDDDYVVGGLEPRRRGPTLERQIDEMKQIWAGGSPRDTDSVGPRPVQQGGPELILGGRADAALARVARVADGWILGAGMPPAEFTRLAGAVDEAWSAAGRRGRPRKLALSYFALGARSADTASSYLHHYYAWRGTEAADQVTASAATTPDAVAERIAAFEEGGCDELVLVPCSAEVEQVELLADAVRLLTTTQEQR